jgi:flagellar hook-associated protein 1
MSGLFGTFNIAKRGMFVQQKAIDVTSHNIANANTEGYSRQRAVIETTRPAYMPSLNNSMGPGQSGTGAQITAIERVRDSFMDFQVRNETSTYGKYEARQTFLSEIESIFNEPSDTGISTLLGKFFDSWQQLSKQAQSSNARTVVVQQSAALADELNHTYKQLEELKKNTYDVMKNTVFDVSNILTQINQLNEQIIGVKVAGNMPNDLMDKRDLLLDKLSSRFNINVDRRSFEGIDVSTKESDGTTIPNLIQAGNAGNPKMLSFIDDITVDPKDPSIHVITYYKKGNMSSEDNKVTLRVKGLDEAAKNDLLKTRVILANAEGLAIQPNGVLIEDGATITADGLVTDKDGKKIDDGTTITLADLKFQSVSGELQGHMSVINDIEDYMDQLNKLAKALTFSVNAVHSGKGDSSNDSMPFFVNSLVAEYNSDNTMKNPGEIVDKENEITAGNISVNKELIYDVMKLKTRTHDDEFDKANENDKDGETDGARAIAIAGLRDVLMAIQDINTGTTREDFIKDRLKANGLGIESNTSGMKIDNYFKDTVDRLGVHTQEAKRMVKNQNSLLNSFEETRLSISGVSLDEEMANLVAFQHAYQANAKIIATVDELLDVVVNGLKR